MDRADNQRLNTDEVPKEEDGISSQFLLKHNLKTSGSNTTALRDFVI